MAMAKPAAFYQAAVPAGFISSYFRAASLRSVPQIHIHFRPISNLGMASKNYTRLKAVSGMMDRFSQSYWTYKLFQAMRNIGSEG